ncbi:uncharacterized protein FIBRA_01226 [Fibroporia radiculosa]|uniref:DUF6593 domain-containing protein n=1 Tax=Fibroporia radiculosa TaxID=599839 RepID=J4I8D3_9APHY|nr:uncharacterized protein FIBRA_01226 [Fibroporia radiculosa]CCL99211.1 predicted protein [Fibroporia radiculosa]
MSRMWTRLRSEGSVLYVSGAASVIDHPSSYIHVSTPFATPHFPAFPALFPARVAKMNPFTQGDWSAGSGIAPSIFGALPSAPITASKTAQSESIEFKFTDFRTTILNCTVVGPQNRVVYRVTTDSGAASGTMWKDNESRNVAMVTWQPNPAIEMRGMTAKQRVRDWLRLSSDQSKRVMTIGGVQYAWSPIDGFICLYKLQSQAPRVLARIARGKDTVLLEMTPEAMQLGLLESSVVATVLFTCGQSID